MSISTNAEESDANQSKFYRVTSSEPITDADDLFDILSNFLMKDKRRQIAMEYLDEKDLISSRLTWVSTAIRDLLWWRLVSSLSVVSNFHFYIILRIKIIHTYFMNN